jgi:hypothetical protein
MTTKKARQKVRTKAEAKGWKARKPGTMPGLFV